MGHNFNMQHDGVGNSCEFGYVMGSSSQPYSDSPPDTFSTCSITYVEEYFQDNETRISCLNNKPNANASQYGICGNGFIENDETCDCGSNNCVTIDPCCNGTICAILNTDECNTTDYDTTNVDTDQSYHVKCTQYHVFIILLTLNFVVC